MEGKEGIDFSRKQLVNELKAVMPGIDKDGLLIEGADMFQFHNGRVYSFNEEISASVETCLTKIVAGDGEEETSSIECAIRADEFFKLLGKLPDDNLTATRDGDKLMINNEDRSIVVELPILPSTMADRLEGLDVKSKWKALPDEFQEAMRACIISQNDTSFDGICVSDDDMLAADHSRVNRFKLSKEMVPFWITTGVANQLCRLEALVQYQVRDRWVHFRTKPKDKESIAVIFSAKRLRIENFPIEKVRSVIDAHNIEKGDTKLTFPSTLMKAVDRAAVFAVDINNYNTVSLRITPGALRVHAHRHGANFTERLKWEEGALEDLPKMSLSVDVDTLKYSIARSREVGIKQQSGKDGQALIRLVFEAGPLRHISSTIDQSDKSE